MTDRIEGVSIIFEKRMSSKDSQKIIDAILQLRGVLQVNPVMSTSATIMVATRERYELHKKLLNLIEPICFDPDKSD